MTCSGRMEAVFTVFSEESPTVGQQLYFFASLVLLHETGDLLGGQPGAGAVAVVAPPLPTDALTTLQQARQGMRQPLDQVRPPVSSLRPGVQPVDSCWSWVELERRD
jgi:hypothetical protein